MTLFDYADRYPYQAGYAKGSDTSQEAAEKLTCRTETHLAILEALKICPMIVDETKVLLEGEMGRVFDRSTIAARFTELEALGRIERTDEVRKTPRNRNAHVYKIKEQ